MQLRPHAWQRRSVGGRAGRLGGVSDASHGTGARLWDVVRCLLRTYKEGKARVSLHFWEDKNE